MEEEKPKSRRGGKREGAGSGGVRKGAGRPPKAKEEEILYRFQNFIGDDLAFKMLKAGIEKGKDFRYIQLYFNYRFGKPKEAVDITSAGKELESINIKDLISFGKDKS